MHRRDIFKQLFSGDLMKHLQENNVAVMQPDVGQAETFNGFRQQQHSTGFSAAADRTGLHVEVFCTDDAWLHCSNTGSERVMRLQTHQLSAEAQSFSASLELQFMSSETNDSFAGIRFGGEESEDAIDVGLTADGHLFIGNERSAKRADSFKIQQHLRLLLNVIAQNNNRSYAKLKLLDTWGNTLVVLNSSALTIQSWSGSISLVNVLNEAGATSVVFGIFQVEGEKLRAVNSNTNSSQII